MHCYKLHLDNFKGDFLNIWIYWHPQILDFQIVASMGSLFIQLSDDVTLNFKRLTLMTFVVQGHIYSTFDEQRHTFNYLIIDKS